MPMKQVSDISDIVDVDPDALVKIFLLESPWPFNTPRNIVQAAGSIWNYFAFLHAGIGFTLEESGKMYAIEFYADDFLGSFFPTFTAANMSFHAVSALRYYEGFDDQYWTSQWVTSKITGLLFKEAVEFAKTYLDSHPIFQPLAVCRWPTEGKQGAILVNSTSSYDFAFSVLDSLASKGVQFSEQLVLPPQATRICMYTEKHDTLVPIDDVVTSFYKETTGCIYDVARACVAYENATDQIPGDFMVGVRQCLWGQTAYIPHHNGSHFHKVHLAGDGIGLFRGTRVIPPRPNPPPMEEDSALFSAVVGGIIIASGLLGLALGIRQSMRKGDHVIPYVPHAENWDMRSPPRSPSVGVSMVQASELSRPLLQTSTDSESL